jgi:hypothetical protein
VGITKKQAYDQLCVNRSNLRALAVQKVREAKNKGR